MTRVPIYGAVLCGGRSRRMGRDKALLELEGQTLLQRALACLDGLAESCVIACGGEPRYGELGRELVLDGLSGGDGADAGPLAGLEAVLAHASRAAPPESGAWVAVLAVDLVRARPGVYRALLARAREEEADACLLCSQRGPEPLLAVYHTRCLGPVQRALRAGERRLVAFHTGHGELCISFFAESELPPELGVDEPARNVNSPAEFLREGGSMP